MTLPTDTPRPDLSFEPDPPTRVVRAYGTWASPISARRAAAGTRRLGMLQANDRWVLWTEGRPDEGGRQAIVGARLGPNGPSQPHDVLQAPYSARSRVHEYGGGELLLDGDDVYFVNAADQGIYHLTLTGDGRVAPVIVRSGWRFADMIRDGQRLVAIAEIHGDDPGQNPDNKVVAIALNSSPNQTPVVLAEGRDFYANPRISPGGRTLAYLTWQLPDLPWDSARLEVVTIDPETLAVRGPSSDLTPLGGAVYCPQFLPDGRLIATHDGTGFGQLVEWPAGQTSIAPSPVFDRPKAEFGKPLWNLGTRTTAVHADGAITAIGSAQGAPVLAHRSATGSITYTQLPDDVVRMDEPIAAGIREGTPTFATIASSTDGPAGVALVSLGRSGHVTISRLGMGGDGDVARENGWIAIGQAELFKRPDGIDVPAIVYRPTSPTHEGPIGSSPPTLVFAHGGPTSAASRALSLRIQFFTSRGFQVVDVDYAGSVGYGRAHRARLDGQWGIADVADCAAVANALANAGRADRKRLAIVGGSAGGYTVLMALATTNVFAAGSCHYGISDLALLDAHTHKFESGYQRRLIGGATAEDYAARLAARSPLNLVDRISAPVIFFQGLDDKVVPPEQTRLMLNSLTQRGIDAKAHEFPGEGHGFRRAETIETVLEAELAFFRSVLKLDAQS